MKADLDWSTLGSYKVLASGSDSPAVILMVKLMATLTESLWEKDLRLVWALDRLRRLASASDRLRLQGLGLAMDSLASGSELGSDCCLPRWLNHHQRRS